MMIGVCFSGSRLFSSRHQQSFELGTTPGEMPPPFPRKSVFLCLSLQSGERDRMGDVFGRSYRYLTPKKNLCTMAWTGEGRKRRRQSALLMIDGDGHTVEEESPTPKWAPLNLKRSSDR